MTEISTSRLRDILARTIGPTPWYWKTFPQVNSPSGQRFAWTHHGSEGPLGYVVSFGLVQEPDSMGKSGRHGRREDACLQRQPRKFRDGLYAQFRRDRGAVQLHRPLVDATPGFQK